MAGGFTNLIDLIQDQQPVRAATPNRPLSQLQGNIQYLKDLLETALLGQAIIAREVTVASGVEVGQPVYFSTSTQQYELALGGVENDPTTNFLRTAARANVVAIVYRKLNATKADLLIGGIAEVDLSAAISGTIAPGIYYLSNATPGSLTSVLPPAAVPVLQVIQEGSTADTWQVILRTQFRDFLENHRHYSYELTAHPSGDHSNPGTGNRHTIGSPNASVEGWLPASHTSFGGLAPAGAKFGYNIAASGLASIWPPVPTSSAAVYMARQEQTDEPLRGAELLTDDHVVIDENGIWWMSDCYNEVPWPTTLNTGTEESVSVSTDPTDCPLIDSVRLFLQWTQSSIFTGQSAVLSLTGREGSGLTFYCRNTDQEKSVGHLEADFDLSTLLNATDQTGHIVFKTLEDGKFNRGPVVESIKSNSPSIGLSSNVTIGDDGKAYGNVELTANIDITNAEFGIDLVRFDGVEEEYYEKTLGIGFPESRAASFRAKCTIPSEIDFPSGTKLKFRFRILARATDVIPSDVFLLRYRRIPAPSALLTVATLPTTDITLALDTGLSVNEDEYFDVESASFTIAAGDQILFTLSRAAPDAFAGELHILGMRGIPVAGS